jgi:hypothetical protein
MPPPIDNVKNWMNMFRWIVKLIRDEHEVDKAIWQPWRPTAA